MRYFSHPAQVTKRCGKETTAVSSPLAVNTVPRPRLRRASHPGSGPGAGVVMPQTAGQAGGGREGTPRMNRVVKTATYLLLMPSPVRQMIQMDQI